MKTLLEMRLEREWSRPFVAEKTGCSVAAVRLWELGKRIPGGIACAALARTFGVTTDEIVSLFETGNPPPAPAAGAKLKEPTVKRDRRKRKAAA